MSKRKRLLVHKRHKPIKYPKGWVLPWTEIHKRSRRDDAKITLRIKRSK